MLIHQPMIGGCGQRWLMRNFKCRPRGSEML